MTFQDNFVRFALAGGAAVALMTGLASSALAKDQREIKVIGRPQAAEIQKERVSYADLNLATPAGVRKLNGRVGGAVSRVCFGFDYVPTSVKAECNDAAWSGARPQMDLAITRAHQIASTGMSSIPPVAIVIALPH